MNLDIERLSPTERLRHHVRRGDHRAAIALALELLDDDTARRSAWLAIQGGATWSCVDEDDEAMHLIHHSQTGWIDLLIATQRWVVVGEFRVRTLWDDQRARLFACDCAYLVLPLFEKAHAEDTRPRQAIDVARRYAMSSASVAELRGASNASYAASYAADYAASYAAHYAAQSAARAADTLYDASYAADYAAAAAHYEDSADHYADHCRDDLEPLLLRCLLLPIDELTTTSLEVEVAR